MRTTRSDLKEIGLIHGTGAALVFACFLGVAVAQMVVSNI